MNIFKIFIHIFNIFDDVENAISNIKLFSRIFTDFHKLIFILTFTQFVINCLILLFVKNIENLI